MRFDGVVVVAGIPGSGKTTLARALALGLGLPLIAKDTIKEALFDALGTLAPNRPTWSDSTRLDDALEPGRNTVLLSSS